MLIPFYLNEQSDSEGRMLQEIWDWDLEELECNHDYIQWFFPIYEQSAFNPNAPVLDRKTVEMFHENPRLHQNLRQSLITMLQLYGLQRHESTDGKIVISLNRDTM